MKKFEVLQFVQIEGQGLDGFGVVAEISNGKCYLMTGDMDEDFGTLEVDEDKIVGVDDSTIRENISEMLKNDGEYAYFLIQLNDIPELEEYHVEETDTLRHVRDTNDILLDN